MSTYTAQLNNNVKCSNTFKRMSSYSFWEMENCKNPPVTPAKIVTNRFCFLQLKTGRNANLIVSHMSNSFTIMQSTCTAN